MQLRVSKSDNLYLQRAVLVMFKNKRDFLCRVSHSNQPRCRKEANHYCVIRSDSNLLPALLHAQNLYHANKDVDKVELEGDALINGIALDVARVG